MPINHGLNTNITDPTLAAHLNRDKLVKYKISTNLDTFNSKRPGHEFNEFDFNSNSAENPLNTNHSKVLNEIIKNSIENTKTNLAKEILKNSQDNDEKKLSPSFIDARFYNDSTPFLKLANQLKKSTLESIKSKPVNVVGPQIIAEKRQQSLFSETNLNSTDNNFKTDRLEYETRIEYMENQMKGIYEQLQIQTQVNVELKKMLVASMSGEDLEYKIERLISDKQRYEYELDNRGKEIEQLSDEIEQLSIQCDLWRSKFQASKLLTEENFAW